MNKSTLVALIVLIFIVAGGIAEVIVITDRYGQMENSIAEYAEKCIDESITEDDCLRLQEQWFNLREQSEIFYANIDLYELNLRITDAAAFVRCKDYKQAYNQLKIAEMLCKYVPDLIKPNIQHII